MPGKLRIAVVDHQPIYRDGIAHAMKAHKVGTVIAQGASMTDAVRIAQTEPPDVMLLEIDIPGMGIAAASAISTSHPLIRIIMLTASEQDEAVVASLRAGARGYVLKSTDSTELARIIWTVHGGESYVAPGLAARMLTRLHSPPPEALPAGPQLTAREDEILRHVKRGHTNKQIATKLLVSEKTIKYYMSNIMQKLNVRNRVEAVMMVHHRDL